MAFTYDLEETGNLLIIATLRLKVGDTIEDSGARPDGRNYSDAEILLAYSEENSDSGRACAFLYEALAAEWSQHATTWRLGHESESGKHAKEYRELAQTFRERHGYTETGNFAESNGGGFSVGVKRG